MRRGLNTILLEGGPGGGRGRIPFRLNVFIRPSVPRKCSTGERSICPPPPPEYILMIHMKYNKVVYIEGESRKDGSKKREREIGTEITEVRENERNKKERQQETNKETVGGRERRTTRKKQERETARDRQRDSGWEREKDKAKETRKRDSQRQT